ncbi:iron ABC transporter permease [Clostridium sediminicola]|uniref:ABC transporter permease n=1 Tax=Clostridium sediminicola TaxID=3114879 RepID=UPI0031F22D5F
MNRIKSIWVKVWRGSPPRSTLLLINIITVLIMSIPIVYIFTRALTAPIKKWEIMLKTRIPLLLWNTLSLAITVALITTIIGVALGFLVEHTNLPGRKFFKIALSLPLVIPPYIGALTYVIFFGPRGILYSLFGESPIDVYSFFSVAFVLSMFTFPYVFLTVSASLRKISANYEEAGRSCGASYSTIVRKIIIPLVKPAILSSSIVVLFYIVSDFGAVSMLRYTTFSSSIYFQMVGSLDRSSAAILSIVLVALGLTILLAKGYILNKRVFYQNPKANRKMTPLNLGKFKYLSLIFVGIVLLFSVILPLSTLVAWSVKGMNEGVINLKTLGYIKNSLTVSMGAAFITMIISVPVAYLKFRNPSKITLIMNNICHMGLVIPGTLLALGMVFFVSHYFSWLIGSQIVLMIGFSIRYMSRNLQSTESSMSLVSKNLDETAYSLGKNFKSVLMKVILPSILPGVLSGGALVLVSSMKELPITLMLRAAGFDTLAVRIWIEASDGFYTRAAPAGLLIVLVSIIPLYFMLKSYKGD